MKKLLSLFLAVIMMLGIATVGFASAEISGWSGDYSVAEGPQDAAERNATIKISQGTATLDAAKAFTGVVQMTVDVYAQNGGSVTLKDSGGNTAGTITLENGKINGTDTAYEINAWNTFKIFALTGVKKYQVYIVKNDKDVFVCENAVQNAVNPIKAEFTSSGEMYIDNVNISQMKKTAMYPNSDITWTYRGGTFPSISTGADKNINVEDGFYLGGDTRSYVNYYGYDDPALGRYMKMSSYVNESIVRPSDAKLELMHKINQEKKNHIFDMELYIPSHIANTSYNKSGEMVTNGTVENHPEIQFGIRDVVDEKAFSLLNMTKKELRRSYYAWDYSVPVDDWFNLRFEVLYESQLFNIYIDGIQVNSISLPLSYDGKYGDLGELKYFYIQLYDNLNSPAEVYMRNLNLGYINGERTEEVFSENFNDNTSKFVYTAGALIQEDGGDVAHPDFIMLSLDSNTSTATGETGVGRLHSKHANDQSFQYRVTEDAPLDLNLVNVPLTGENEKYIDTTAKASTFYYARDARYHNETAMDLSDAESIDVSFKFYNAAMSRRTTNGAGYDSMAVMFTEQETDNDNYAKAVASPYLRFFRFMYFDVKQKGNYLINPEAFTYHTDGVNGVKKWYDFNMKIVPEDLNSQYKFTINGNSTSVSPQTHITKADLAKLKYINFAIDDDNGGRFYIDDIVISKLVKLASDYIKNYYSVDVAKVYEDNISMPAAQGASVEINFTDGKYISGVPMNGYKLNNITLTNKEVLDNGKLIAAIYDGGEMTEVAIMDKKADGVYTLADKAISVTGTSLVRLFNITAMNTLVPKEAPISVDKNISRTKLWVIGDSTAAHYPDSIGANDIHGYGDFINDYVDTNKVEVLNYGVSGRSAKSIVEGLHAGHEDTTFNELFGENGLVGKGDFVLICLGINDSHIETDWQYSTPMATEETKGSFRYYMNKLVGAAVGRGATPILITEQPRLNFSAANGDSIPDTFVHSDQRLWTNAVLELAEAKKLPVIDCYGMGSDYWSNIGYSAAKDDFRLLDGEIDTTHLSLNGAKRIAGFIAKGLKTIDGIGQFVK